VSFIAFEESVFPRVQALDCSPFSFSPLFPPAFLSSDSAREFPVPYKLCLFRFSGMFFETPPFPGHFSPSCCFARPELSLFRGRSLFYQHDVRFCPSSGFLFVQPSPLFFFITCQLVKENEYFEDPPLSPPLPPLFSPPGIRRIRASFF